MKEAFWGVLIIVLGLFGIVVVNLFQNVTIDNDRVYYLIKESTEASAYDAIDLTYYRLSGNIRMVEDKFVENLTRRFAQNITVGNYRIVVQDINEIPPKISLGVRSGVTSLRGEKFEITNRLDAVIETKYKLSDVLDFLGITYDQWTTYLNKADPSGTSGSEANICKLGATSDEDKACISGDIVFVGFGDAVGLKKSYCQDEALPRNVARPATYKQCDCGTWVSKTETVYANPTESGRERIYTWSFSKTTDARTINESITERVNIDVCTTAIVVDVPKNPDTLKPSGNPNEPSSDNSAYIDCPRGGIRIPQGTIVTLHPRYIPPEATNRRLTWTSSNTGVTSLIYSNPGVLCSLNSTYTNCMSKAVVTAKQPGVTTVTVKTSNNKTGTCTVNVWDGSPDTMTCNSIELIVGEKGIINSGYTPKNATKTNFTFTSSNNDIVSISGNNVTANKSGTVTITMRETNSGKTTTCNVTSKLPPEASEGGASSGGGSGWGAWWYTDELGTKHYVATEAEAQTNASKYSKMGEGSFGVVSDSGMFTKGAMLNENYYRDFSGNVYDSISKKAADAAKEEANNKGGGGGSCFPAGTPVKTINGYKDIERIKIGDIVLTYNFDTKNTEYKKVIDLKSHNHLKQDIYEITINNEVIKTTGNHLFYINSDENPYKFNLYNGKRLDNKIYKPNINLYGYCENDKDCYVEARYLSINDKLLTSNGTYKNITNIKHYHEEQYVYNIEVEDNHNYYVGNDGYLVHNFYYTGPSGSSQASSTSYVNYYTSS